MRSTLMRSLPPNGAGITTVFPAGYRERLANRFYYDGEDAGKVDHIHVRIVDYTIVEA